MDLEAHLQAIRKAREGEGGPAPNTISQSFLDNPERAGEKPQSTLDDRVWLEHVAEMTAISDRREEVKVRREFVLLLRKHTPPPHVRGKDTTVMTMTCSSP